MKAIYESPVMNENTIFIQSCFAASYGDSGHAGKDLSVEAEYTYDL